MGLTTLRETRCVSDVESRYPVTDEHRVDERRKEIFSVLSGEDKRLMIIGGPCSAWPFDADHPFPTSSQQKHHCQR